MNSQEFQQKLDSAGKPIVVDFWAAWCGPCMMTKPILDKLGKEYAGDVEFLPINADTSREVLEKYRVFGIPTVLAIQNGREVARMTGAQNEAGYRAVFESLANGREVKIPMSQFDRMLRLGAGGLFMMIGISNGNWLVVGIGGILAFMGIYDRCPIWNALTRMFQRK
ncbi:MAG: thioredoxin [Chloroflexi bacterium]|nr:thioredoxin [Chloroflexota bacterium]